MIYHVRAKLRDDTAGSLLSKIGDGSIARQQPDGPELVASMERAVINAAGEIEWSEMCFCPSPLHHERTTLLDAHFENIITEPIDAHADYEGEPLLKYLSELI